MSEMVNEVGFAVNRLTDLIGGIGEAVRQQTENINMIFGKFGDLSNGFEAFKSDISTEMKTMKSDVKSEVQNFKEELSKDVMAVKKEINEIKEYSEITTEQRNAIKRAVNRQVYRVLGLPEKKSDCTVEDLVKLKKYSQLFHQRCYSEVAKLGALGSPLGTTKEKNFIQAIKDIEAWVPSNGVSGLMKEADDNAVARKIAREQGYN